MWWVWAPSLLGRWNAEASLGLTNKAPVITLGWALEDAGRIRSDDQTESQRYFGSGGVEGVAIMDQPYLEPSIRDKSKYRAATCPLEMVRCWVGGRLLSVPCWRQASAFAFPRGQSVEWC